MAKTSKHIIQKQIFKLEIPNQESFNDIANTIQSIFYKDILPQLDEVFSKYAPSGITIQIDKLVLDIGDIDVKNLKRDLSKKIVEAVENQLYLEFRKIELDYHGVENTRISPISQISQERSQLRLLSYFLETGRLPWWSERSIDLNELFTDLIQEHPSLVRSLIYRLAANKYIRQRIVYQFSDETIHALFKVLTPQQANFFRTYVEDLQAIHEREKVVNETSYKFKKVVQELIFIYIIDHQQTAINQREFAKENLKQLAKKYRISYFEILEQLNVAFESISSRRSSEFKQIAKDLLTEAIEEKQLKQKADTVENQTSTNQVDIIEILETFLIYGYISNRRFYQLFQNIEAFFQSLLQEQPLVIRALIYKIGTSRNVRQRIVSTFEENTIYELIAVLTPQQAFYFKEHITSLAIINERTEIINAKTERFRKVVQELILKYITERRTSIFNEVDFLRHQIQNLSKNYRLEYKFVLEELQAAIQKYQAIQSSSSLRKNIEELYEMDIFASETEEKKIIYTPIQVLETYLTYGFYLADNEIDIDIDTLLYELLKENSISTKQLIFNLKSNENVIKRLAHQFSDETTNELFSVLSAQSPVFFGNFIENITHYQQQTTIINEEQRVFQKIIKEFILIYLLHSTSSTFDKTEFTQQIIADLAKKYQISFEALLASIQSFFEANEQKIAIATTFIQILKTIRKEQNFFIESFTHYQQQTNPINEEERVFQKIIKEFILIFLSDRASSTFDKTEFTQQIIAALAKKYQISFEALLASIQSFFEANEQKIAIATTFIQILKTIRKEQNVQLTISGKEKILEVDAIVRVIETGQLKTTKTKVTIEFLEQLIIQKTDNARLKQVFQEVKTTQHSVRQLSKLSQKASKKIWNVLSENKGDYIEELIESFLKAQQQFRFLDLGSLDLNIFLKTKVLNFLLHQTFNLKTLTHYLITELAVKFKTSERQIVGFINKKVIKKDLQQSLEIVEKEIVKTATSFEEENRTFTNLELFEFILNKGYIPASVFYAQKSVDINELFQSLLSTQHFALQKIMRSIQFQPRKVSRLVYQLNVENLKQLSKIIVNQPPKWFATAQKTLIHAINSIPNVLLSISLIEQLVTEYSVRYLLEFGQQTQLAQLDFWTYLLEKLEQSISNTSQQEMLRYVEQQEDKTINQSIEPLKSIINSKSLTLSEISKNEQAYETFNYILEQGKLPWWSVYQSVQELEKWFSKISNPKKKRWLQLIEKHYNRSIQTIHFISSLFSEKFLNQIILAYAPNFGGIIISYQAVLLQVKKMGVEPKEVQKLIQQFTIEFLVSKQFDLKTYLASSLDFLEQKTLLKKKDYIQQISEIAAVASLENNYRFYALIDMLKDLPKSLAKEKFEDRVEEEQTKPIRTLTEWEIIIYFFRNKILPKGYQHLTYNELMQLIRKNIASHQNVAQNYFRKMLKNKSRLDVFKQLVRKDEQELIFDLIDFSESDEGKKAETTEKSKKKPLKIDVPLTAPEDEDIYISNAGIILIHPLLNMFFTRLNLMHFRKWRDEAAQQRAILLLHYIATEQTTASEPELVLGKLLCGWELWKPLELEFEITDEEANMCQSILKGTLYNWERMRNSTPEALRQTFIQRSGKLKEETSQWLLTIERETFDMLLSTIDWQISMINFSWMPKMLRVDWTP